MEDILYYLLLIALLAAGVVGGAVLWRSYVDGEGLPGSRLFKPRQEPRLDIVEQSNVDGRRRLVLIRRDDTEHLIMTGGPVDVVIETGIKTTSEGATTRARTTADVVEPPVFSRQPRTFGQSAGE